MTKTVPLENSAKTSFLFLEFRTGNPLSPTFHRYTDRAVDTVLEDVMFTSVQAIECDIGKRTGTMDEPTSTIKMPRDTFLDRISNGEPHAPIRLTIREAVEDDGVLDLTFLFKGRVMRSARNFDGRTELVRLDARSWKQKDLDFLLGIPIHGKCPFTFLERGCFLPGGRAAVEQEGTLTAISGLAVTITGTTAPRDRYFDQGYIEKDGLRIKIRDYDSGDSFALVRQPPDDWLGADVIVVPGCDQQHSTCKLWLNEEHFGGIGKVMQARNPLIDVE